MGFLEQREENFRERDFLRNRDLSGNSRGIPKEKGGSPRERSMWGFLIKGKGRVPEG